KLDETPFDFQRRRVSVLAEHQGQRLLILKGAPEEVIGLCDRVAGAGGSDAALTDAARAALNARFRAMGHDGCRALAVATRAMPANRDAITADDEAGLTFEGFVAFVDPPKASAGEALKALRRRGVAIKILTGDSEEVSRHVCRALGFHVCGALDGRTLEGLSEEALSHR